MLRFFVNKAADYDAGSDRPLKVPVAQIQSTLRFLVTNIEDNFKPTERNAEDGLYLGTAGVAYMFYHLSKVPALHAHKAKFISSAVEYLKPALELANKQKLRVEESPSFLLGSGGVFAVGSVVAKAIGNVQDCDKFTKLYENAAYICKSPVFLRCGSDELFVGRAGYICGTLWMTRENGNECELGNVHDLCKLIVNSGRAYSKRHKSASPLMYAYYDVEYIGAGHGLASILQYLMSVPKYLDSNPGDAKDIKLATDYIVSLQDEDGNFPTATDDVNLQRYELVHWCHGAGGIAFLLAKAYVTWGDRKYLEALIKAGDLIWERGLLKKGPGICHGISGNGYVFLLLYRLTKDKKYLHRAVEFYKFMCSDTFQREARAPDNPYSLYEGIAGMACFLGDLLQPDEATFPFSDIFG